MINKLHSLEKALERMKSSLDRLDHSNDKPEFKDEYRTEILERIEFLETEIEKEYARGNGNSQQD